MTLGDCLYDISSSVETYIAHKTILLKRKMAKVNKNKTEFVAFWSMHHMKKLQILICEHVQ